MLIKLVDLLLMNLTRQNSWKFTTYNMRYVFLLKKCKTICIQQSKIHNYLYTPPNAKPSSKCSYDIEIHEQNTKKLLLDRTQQPHNHNNHGRRAKVRYVPQPVPR